MGQPSSAASVPPTVPGGVRADRRDGCRDGCGRDAHATTVSLPRLCAAAEAVHEIPLPDNDASDLAAKGGDPSGGLLDLGV